MTQVVVGKEGSSSSYAAEQWKSSEDAGGTRTDGGWVRGG